MLNIREFETSDYRTFGGVTNFLNGEKPLIVEESNLVMIADGKGFEVFKIDEDGAVDSSVYNDWKKAKTPHEARIFIEETFYAFQHISE